MKDKDEREEARKLIIGYNDIVKTVDKVIMQAIEEVRGEVDNLEEM
jgi:hypothetical protein